MAINPAERRGAVISLVPQEPRSEFSRRLDLVEEALNLSLNAVHVFRWDNPENAVRRASWAYAHYQQEAVDRRALWDSYHNTDRVFYTIGGTLYRASQVELEIDEMRRLAEAEGQGVRAAGYNDANFPSSGLAFGERVLRLHLVGGNSQPERSSDNDPSLKLTYVSGPVVNVALKVLDEYDSTGDVEPKVLDTMRRFVDNRSGLPDMHSELWEIYTPQLDGAQLSKLDDYAKGKGSLAVPRYFGISAWDPNRTAGQTNVWVRHTEEAKRPL
jgi:hypothetical protein